MFQIGDLVEDVTGRAGKVAQYHRRTGMVRVRWAQGEATFEGREKLRLVEPLRIVR
jgi:hypothetical protein